MRDEVVLCGRILFSLVFLVFGTRQLTQTEGMAQYAAFKKVPSPKLMVQVSGVAMLLGGLAVILGIYMDLAGLLLAILLLAMAFMMHRFWEETDPQTKAAEMAQFLKNISMAGAGLIIAAVSAYWPYTITDGCLK